MATESRQKEVKKLKTSRIQSMDDIPKDMGKMKVVKAKSAFINNVE